MKRTIAILATFFILILVAPALAQDMPTLIYDFTWSINSNYHAIGDSGPSTHVSLSGSGPLTYAANPQVGFGMVTMSFGTPSNGGIFRFNQVGTGSGPHPDDNFSFTTGLETLNPPFSGSCGSFPSQSPCRVAAFTTPGNAFATPSSFTLYGQYGFQCLSQFGTGCNGAASWESMLTGTATLHTASATAAEPASLIVVAAGLVGARMLRRRRTETV
jgi:hypothetical protein